MLFLRYSAVSIIGLLIVLGLSGCGGEESTTKLPIFDGQRAFSLLEKQVSLGPRNPNSPGWQAMQEWLKDFTDSIGVDVRVQKFDYLDYLTGDTLHLVNWIIPINPERKNRILIGGHYDCRPRAEHDPDPDLRERPILGANDGASSTAVILHLAELMIDQPPFAGVDLILFDGEDYGPPGRLDQYLIGSSHFAQTNKTEYRFGILLDMIGDKDLRIYRESSSQLHAGDVNDLVWETAARQNATAFIDSIKYTVMDDHIPLIAAGIPTVDLIDFDYPVWHTQADTPDKCSAASLETVGLVVLEVIYNER